MVLVHDLRYGILTCKHRRNIVAEVALNPVTSGVAQWSISGGYYDISRHELVTVVDAQELQRLVSCIEDNMRNQLRHRMKDELLTWVIQELDRLKRVTHRYPALDEAIRGRNVTYIVR